MNYKFIAPFAGALIGYFTNWLAIKMLFLPRKAKYIGKFKVPFTPGLIPKEKAKISKKIAKVIQENILNKDTIINNVFSDENKENIFLYLENNFEMLKENDYTIKIILKKFNLEEESLDIFIEKLIKVFENILEKEENKELIINLLTKNLVKLAENMDKKEEYKDFIQNTFSSIINDFKIKEKFLNKRLSQLIGKENISKIKLIIFENLPKLLQYISEKLTYDENLNNKLKTFIQNLIEENLGSFKSLFINSEKVYENIKNSIIIYINEPENQNKIGLKIFDYISKNQDKKFYEILEYVPKEMKLQIKENFFEKDLKEIFNKFSLTDLINKNENNIQTFLKNLLNENFNKTIISNINCIIKNNRNKILNFRINILLGKINLNKFKDKFEILLNLFVEKKAHKIIEKIDIYKMVQNKIDEFNVSTIENIILSVAKKELNAITIIGGVLGFLIGLLSIFF